MCSSQKLCVPYYTIVPLTPQILLLSSIFLGQQIRLYYRLRAVCFPCKFTWFICICTHKQSLNYNPTAAPVLVHFNQNRKCTKKEKRSRKRTIKKKKTHTKDRESKKEEKEEKNTTNEAHKAIRLFLVFLRFFCLRYQHIRL